LDPNNRKVELQIRQTKLKKIYEEYVKICVNDPKMAIESVSFKVFIYKLKYFYF